MPSSRAHKAVCLRRQGDHSGLSGTRHNLAKTQTSFEQATRLAPKDPGAWLLLAPTYSKQKDEKIVLAAAQSPNRRAARIRESCNDS